MHRSRPTTGTWCLCAATPRCSVADASRQHLGRASQHGSCTTRASAERAGRRTSADAAGSWIPAISAAAPALPRGRRAARRRGRSRRPTGPPRRRPHTAARRPPGQPGPVRAASSTRSRAGHGRRRTLPAPPAHDATAQRPTRVDVGPRLPRVAMVFTCRNCQRAARGANSSQLAQLLGFGSDPRSSYLAIKLPLLNNMGKERKNDF